MNLEPRGITHEAREASRSFTRQVMAEARRRGIARCTGDMGLDAALFNAREHGMRLHSDHDWRLASAMVARAAQAGDRVVITGIDMGAP